MARVTVASNGGIEPKATTEFLGVIADIERIVFTITEVENSWTFRHGRERARRDSERSRYASMAARPRCRREGELCTVAEREYRHCGNRSFCPALRREQVGPGCHTSGARLR